MKKDRRSKVDFGVFLAQGYESKEEMSIQDSEHCVLLHKHHPFSVGKGSKHANVKGFFVFDEIEKRRLRSFVVPLARW